MSAVPTQELLQRFAAVVGQAHVLTDAPEVAPYLVDWRKQYRGAALAVLRPAATAQVAALVALCAREGIAVVPQGGNTGLCGGSVPTGTRAEVVVSLGRMNRVRALDVLNDTITAEAGCILAQVQQAADDAGRLFPLSLGAEGSCTIGGNLSTNAGGVNVLRYGNARAQVLGLEVVLPDGRVWDGLRGLRKDNTGYDLKQLFVGAEGTLGVITAAVLKLYAKPSASATAWIGVDDPQHAVELLSALRERLGDRLTAFELISRRCLEAVLALAPSNRDPLPAAHPWYVLAELADSGDDAALAARAEQALAACTERGALRDVAMAQSEAQAVALWKLRDTIPEAQFRNVKHDVSVPVSKVPALIADAQRSLKAAFPGCEIYAFGHIGDGNVHYNVGMAESSANEALIQRSAEVNAIVYDTVAALGGSISAEHGLGQLKRVEVRHHKDALELDLMRAVKQVLDPRGIMNPGKVL